MSTYANSAQPWINQIVDILDRESLSFLDLLRQILRSGHNVRNLTRHRLSIVQNVDVVADLLVEQAEESFRLCTAKIAIDTYRSEILFMTEKKHGLHFGARTATLEQLETFRIEDLDEKIHALAPCLWDAVTVLLDADPKRRRVFDKREDVKEAVETSGDEDQEPSDEAAVGSDSDEDSDDELYYPDSDDSPDLDIGPPLVPWDDEYDAVVAFAQGIEELQWFSDEEEEKTANVDEGQDSEDDHSHSSSDDSSQEESDAGMEVSSTDDDTSNDEMDVDGAEDTFLRLRGGAGEDAPIAKSVGIDAKKKRKLRTQDRARRTKELMTIKRVTILSMLGNSTNEKFNPLQSIIGLFLESKSCPEIVVELVAHMGVSISNQSIRNMINSLHREAKQRLRKLDHVNNIYDNFDLDFAKAQPTLENRKHHWSATAATFVPYKEIDKERDLKFVEELHESSALNPMLEKDDPKIVRPKYNDILPKPAEKGKSVMDALKWHILSIIVEHGGAVFEAFREQLGKPAGVQVLPCEKKDVQYPANVIDADEGTNDGNWEVIEDLFKQRDVPNASHQHYVQLFHGDLGSKERIDSVKKSRRIEKTSYNRLDSIVFIPGLFHLKMAAANAYWRIHEQPKEDRAEKLGLHEYLNMLRPKATGEFTSKNGPSFRSMHDTIHHATWADFLDIWRVEIQAKHGFASLQSYAESGPKWEEIVALAEIIVEKHVPTGSFTYTREEPEEKRDMLFESLCLRNQHGLLYLELCRAMNYGDVGRLLQLLPYWIAIFQSTGKHKYASHMTKFLTDVTITFPYRLQQAILRNWMFNSKATEDAFRGFDWLQELNNLYTKVIFAGKGPNRTKRLIMKRSPLLEVYRSMQKTIEDNFYLTHRTIHHSKPRMTKSIQRVVDHIATFDGHVFKAGRTSSIPQSARKWNVMHAVGDGFDQLQQKKDLFKTDGQKDTGAREVDGADVGVE